MTFNGPVKIEAGALYAVAPYLKEQGYRQVAIAADGITYKVAGERLEREIERAGIRLERRG